MKTKLKSNTDSINKTEQDITIGKCLRRFLIVPICYLLILICLGKFLTTQMESEQETGDKILENLIEALNTKDEEKFEKLFSETTRNTAVDLEQQINEVITFYQGGEHIEYTGDENSETLTDYGEKTEQVLTGDYTLTTDRESYRIGFIYNHINKEKTDEAGLVKIEIVKKSLFDQEDFHWQFFKAEPGAYFQE